MSNLTLGSLFDGSGGFPLAGMMAGITPVWASEIEPFPIRVTTKRIPQMKHYGDISKMNGAEIEPVDIITFGSPCQNLSLAGKREGLTGEKSSMFFEAIRVIKEMRCATNGKYPRWIVWENVPGALSSSKGQDFRTVLEEICKIKDETVSVPMPEKKWTGAGEIMGNGYSVAYRILDAQFWGVPQRRRRVFLVADFTGECAGKVLFESEGVFGNFKKSLSSRQGTAGAVKTSIGETGTICLNDQGGERMDVTEDKTTTLRAQAHHPPCVMHSAGFCTEHSENSRSIGYEEETSPTLRAGVVPAAMMFENHSQDTRYIGPLKVAQTVLATFGTGGNNQPFVVHTPKTLKIRGGCDGGGKGALVQENKSATLSCNNDQTLFEPKAYGICSKDSNSMRSANPNSGIYEADTSRTIDGNGGNPSCNQGGMAIVCIDQGGGKSNCSISIDKSPTLSCTHSGEPTVCIQGSMIGRKSKNGPNGSGINQDTSFTLNTVDRHAVAYGIDRAAFNQGKNALYNFAIEEEKQPTMVAKGPGAVAEPTYSSSKASFFTRAEKECANTLVASDYKDPPLVNDTNGTEYIVRRLTPKECALLQGFPMWWCDELGTENPTEEEIAEWTEVFETHRKALGRTTKPKTRNQIIKWLKNPHSDSAEYTMWGNGVALPCVVYVMNGIAYSAGQQ